MRNLCLNSENGRLDRLSPYTVCAGSSLYRSHGPNSPRGGVRSQGRPARAATKWPGRDTPGGVTLRPLVCARVLTRLKRRGWMVQPLPVGWTTIHGGHVGVLGGFAWRKRCENLTDEVPRRSPVARLGISIALRPMPKCGCDAAESAGQSLALAPQGPQRVRRRSPVFFETKRTHLR